MPIVNELICAGENKGISFGNYELAEKAKVDGFELAGDIYKVKTFNEITKLERNGLFVYESVPGTAVNNLTVTDKGMSFVTSLSLLFTLSVNPAGNEIGNRVSVFVQLAEGLPVNKLLHIGCGFRYIDYPYPSAVVCAAPIILVVFGLHLSGNGRGQLFHFKVLPAAKDSLLTKL